jgi:hypothetical protein
MLKIMIYSNLLLLFISDRQLGVKEIVSINKKPFPQVSTLLISIKCSKLNYKNLRSKKSHLQDSNRFLMET